MGAGPLPLVLGAALLCAPAGLCLRVLSGECGAGGCGGPGRELEGVLMACEGGTIAGWRGGAHEGLEGCPHG